MITATDERKELTDFINLQVESLAELAEKQTDPMERDRILAVAALCGQSKKYLED